MSQHNDLLKRIDDRLDRLEAKLDTYLTKETHNSADIKWIKGFIKFNLSILLAVISAVISLFFTLFKS